MGRLDHCVGDCIDGFILGNDAFVQMLRQTGQLFFFALEQFPDRNACPVRYRGQSS